MYDTGVFQGRTEQHAAAVKVVEERLAEYGLVTQPWDGAYVDAASLAARFRPDLIVSANGKWSALIYVKSESAGRPHFAVEVDSYTAAVEHQEAGHSVALSYVDLSIEPAHIMCCWREDSYRPGNIIIPERSDYRATKEDLGKIYPYAWFFRDDRANGSGTPYYLVPKDGFRLGDFDEFVNAKLLPFLESGEYTGDLDI
jgi:hypothetical protein